MHTNGTTDSSTNGNGKYSEGISDALRDLQERSDFSAFQAEKRIKEAAKKAARQEEDRSQRDGRVARAVTAQIRSEERDARTAGKKAASAVLLFGCLAAAVVAAVAGATAYDKKKIEEKEEPSGE